MNRLRDYKLKKMRDDKRLEYGNALLDAEIEFVATLSYEEREELIKELLTPPHGVI